MYLIKSITARRTANVTMRLAKHFGDLPPREALIVYRARVAAHLTYGAELALDVSKGLLALLEAVEVHFLRRTLHLHDRSRLCVLYSETGLLPLRFVRVDRALRFLSGLLQAPDTRLVVSCLGAYVALWEACQSGWLSDIVIVMQRLGVTEPQDWLATLSTVQGVNGLRTSVEQSWKDQLGVELTAQRLPLLLGRRQWLSSGWWTYEMAMLRNYLLLRVPAHRTALVRMITDSHVLAVEAANWVLRPEGQHNPLPQEWRLCHLCGEGVEDELHVMLECAAPVLVQLCLVMLNDVWQLFPGLKGRAQAPLQ